MSQLHSDSHWPRASEWLAKGGESPVVGIVGCPLNHSITPGHCDQAPAAIRQALARFSTHSYQNLQGLDGVSAKDWGDVTIQAGLNAPLAASPCVILGGDNGVTLLGVRALALSASLELSRVGLITLDAHHDLRHLDDGDHNGNPVRRLLLEGLPGQNIVQIGIQSFANSAPYAGVAEQAGITVITNEQCHEHDAANLFYDQLEILARKVDVIYFDLDLDVMDRAYAPGCPGSRPGGLTPWQVRQIARAAGHHPKVYAMDLVELDPTKDLNDSTALAAAACLLEFAAGKASQ